MEQSHAKGPSRDPSRVGIVEFSENVAGVVAAIFRNGKDAYDNGEDTGKCPENGKGLYSVSNVASEAS
jgi:hypothetical protein